MARFERLLNWRRGRAQTVTHLSERRAQEAQAAVVFLHGFTGRSGQTWQSFADQLLALPEVASWDVFDLGYSTSLSLDVPGIWSADPTLDTVTRSFRTELATPPLSKYRSVALVAHSMGGLVLQRALLDDAALAARVSHVMLFGTPSCGLLKASLLGALKRQLRDMADDGDFIRRLRSDWSAKYPGRPEFDFLTVAGETDEFVPARSSIGPFHDECVALVPGNHLGMIQADDAQHRGVRLLAHLLTGRGAVPGAVDGARLAVERGHFREAVNVLLPRAADLDMTAVGSLALALDGLGRGDEALKVLEAHLAARSSSGGLTTDAMGILAGRLKRRWLVERAEADLARAKRLYSDALSRARDETSPDQMYYHAINMAFLDLLASPPGQPVPEGALKMARIALDHCAAAQPSAWRSATEGEAHLILGDFRKAEARYRAAMAKASGPRAVQSMHSQAIRVADRVAGEAGVDAVERFFGMLPPKVIKGIADGTQGDD